MLETVKKIFGLKEGTNFSELVKRGALILDVRTKNEYQAGHIPGSINIPVDVLHLKLEELKNKKVPIITCCASGMRSGNAKNILKANGFLEVFNGGGWYSLKNKIKK